MIAIGIDPGLTGAIAAVNLATRDVRLHDIPTCAVTEAGQVRNRIDGRALIRLLRELVPAADSALWGLEAVRAMPGSTIQSQGSLLRSLGAIETALDIMGARPHMLPPAGWKRAYGLHRRKGEPKAAWKRRSLEVARTLYPGAAALLARAKDADRAEALLIAHHVGMTQA